MACSMVSVCELNQTLRDSVVARVRYADVLPVCERTRGEDCSLFHCLSSGEPVPRNMLPDGSLGLYLEAPRQSERKFLVIEDSSAFAMLASSAIRTHMGGARVDCRASLEEALPDLRDADYTAVICGYGLGHDDTVHDVRRATDAPIIVLTGRPGDLDLPSGSRVVMKGAGPLALVSALKEALA